MKRLFFLLFILTIVISASVPVIATGQITLHSQAADHVMIGLSGSDKATIDWGDGSPVETLPLKFSITAFKHTYSNAAQRTITINGNIRGLVCTDMQLTGLDVSKSTGLSILDCSRNKLTTIDVNNNLALRHLTCTDNQLTNLDVSKITWLALIRCSNNQLTSLDLSKNIGLKYIYCDNNKLNTTGMENFFRSLHTNVINGGKAIWIANNPGSNANTGIARERGWTITQQAQAQAQPQEAQVMENSYWKVGYTTHGIHALEGVKDNYHANLLNGNLAGTLLAYKVKDGVWLKLNPNKREMKADENAGTISFRDVGIGNTIEMTQTFKFEGEMLRWNIDIVNNSKFPIEIGDLAIPFPVRSRIGGLDPTPIFQQSFSRHAFVSGDASFLYFTRINGEAPFYLMTVEPGTKLEYTDNSLMYIYSGKTGTAETRGTWRQEHTRGWLQPKGANGDKMSFGFTLHIADSYPEMKEKIVANRSIDIDVLPGMTLPIMQKAKFSLKTVCNIDSIRAEFPEKTVIKYLGKKGTDTHIYEVAFNKLGENLLTVHFDGGRKTYLEFFSCESPETITKKRSSFLVNSQQFRDPTKWYDGLYGVYDMKNGQLRGPDNPDIYDESLTYFLASDDPALGKAPFLASKNVVFPNDEEIASIEYHIKNFIWGGLQRTDKETPYPYGIYGTPNWFINRDHDLRITYTEQKLVNPRMWRSFDYAHLAMLYWHMYQIATLYPEKSKFMTADQYLEMAYRTAVAFFVYPVEFLGEYYEPYKWGCYNELVMVDIINELEIRGFSDKAAELRFDWEKKSKYFIYDDPFPYSSEYITDRTAFESTYFLAKYGVMHPMKPDENLWYDQNKAKWYSHPTVTKDKARDFMERQHIAGLSYRGYLAKQWYRLGGDASFSYMARMGASAILDYGYRFSDNPYEWIRLGYAGYLGPYGMVNTGTAESNWGYWYPGKEKDGAIGQAFTSVKFGSNWILTEESRGPWRYCGEADLGMCAITRTAATMLVDDPIFGWSVFGGNMTEEQKQFAVYPDDGARIRFRIVNDKIRIGLELNRDNWSATQPIVVNKNMKSVELKLENGTGNKHTTRLTVEAKGTGSPRLTADNKTIHSKQDRYGNYVFEIPVEGEGCTLKVTWR
ncbi:hypothetical protein M2137_000425 [Parabacteroides sp. PFB2-10]|uniref:DUF5695 domain-containing protein n=1 Tax=Parabacteroides sp. PFB2-10 TaxID=1742405 RepID=UPI0024739170|nr:DUF5695 domain-containing protein [Parabacteroides sp. PFB2-10]MDH6311666.1 hypothetical protein [Parabacteroides sp. PFB2-10]